MQKIKNILLVSHSQLIGGAERCLIDLCKGLNARGYVVSIVVPSIGPNFNVFQKYCENVYVVSYPWWLSRNTKLIQIISSIISHFYATYKIIKLLIKLKPDIVINNTITVPSAALAAKIMNIRLLWFIHEFGDKDHNFIYDYGKNLSYWIVNKLSDQVLVNSKFLYDYLKKYINPNKMNIINYSIVLENENDLNLDYSSSQDLNLYLIGQIQEGKGQLSALEAFVLIQGQQKKSNLTFIGQVSDVQYLERLKKFIQLNKLENVKFINHTDNPFELISGFSVGLVCSNFEAFGRITIEYMKLGIPVIGLNYPNTNNLIKDNVNGFLYSDKGEPSLDQVILKVAKLDGSDLQRIVNNAKQYSKDNFNLEKYLSDVTKHF